MISKRSRAFIAAAVLAGSLAAQAMAETIWINSEAVEIRAGKGAVYPVLVTAHKGDQLTVLAHEGKWLKVNVGGKEGYVFETAVSSTQVGSGGNLLSNLGAGGTDMSTASAAKGLEPSAQTYASSKGLDPMPLRQLIDKCKAICPKEWEAFAALVTSAKAPAAPQNH